MKGIIKIVAILISFIFLVSCGEQVHPNVDYDSSYYEKKEIKSSDADVTPEKTEDDKGNLLVSTPENDTSLSVYGTIKDDAYSADIEAIGKTLNEYKNTVSMVAYSLDNSKMICYNTDEPMFCACTVKAGYVLFCLKQMQKGKGTFDTVLTYEQKHFEPGTGDLQNNPFGTQFTLRTILEKTMMISDNVGYMMAVDYFGRDGYNKWVESIGCPSMKIEPTVWCLGAKVKEQAIIWQRINDFFDANTEYSKFLYSICTNTDENFGTRSLSEPYSHKQGNNSTGEYRAFCDSGIVWKVGSPYIYVIYTNASGPSAYDQKMMSDVMRHVNSIF